MLIMSQLDDMIVNFDLVSDIFIRDRTHIIASCPHIENYTLTLGRYETAERAKEVLREIMDTFIEIEEPKYILRPVGSPKVYYMPEE